MIPLRTGPRGAIFVVFFDKESLHTFQSDFLDFWVPPGPRSSKGPCCWHCACSASPRVARVPASGILCVARFLSGIVGLRAVFVIFACFAALATYHEF